MANKKETEIADAMTLAELQRQSQVYDPPIETMLERFGFADEIGVNDTGSAAVPVEVASEFLGVYEATKTSRVRQRHEYERFLRERKVAISRAAIEAQHEAEVQRQASKVIDDEAPTFQEWEVDHGGA